MPKPTNDEINGQLLRQDCSVASPPIHSDMHNMTIWPTMCNVGDAILYHSICDKEMAKNKQQ